MIPALAPLTAPATRPCSEIRLPGGRQVITVAWPGARVAEVRLLLPMPAGVTAAAWVLARLLPQLPVLGASSLCDAVAELGGDVEAHAADGWLTLSAYALDVHLADLLGLLGALRTAPMPDDLIATVTTTAMLAAQADAARADAQARRILLGDEPPATALAELRPDDVRAAWAAQGAATLLCVGAGHDIDFAATWAGSEPAAAVAAGPVAPVAAEAGGPVSAGAPAAVAPPVPAGSRLLADLPGAVQATIGLAGPAPALTDPAWAGFTLAHTAFGAMPTSRIMRSLRETHGYTYSPYSFIEQRRGAGHHIATIAVSAEVAGPALRVLVDDMAAIAVEPPAGAELDTARRSTVGRLMRTTHTPKGLADHLAGLLRNGVPASALDGLLKSLIAADDQQVAAGARSFAPQNSSLVIVGDAEQLAPALEGDHGTWTRYTDSAR